MDDPYIVRAAELVDAWEGLELYGQDETGQELVWWRIAECVSGGFGVIYVNPGEFRLQSEHLMIVRKAPTPLTLEKIVEQKCNEWGVCDVPDDTDPDIRTRFWDDIADAIRESFEVTPK